MMYRSKVDPESWLGDGGSGSSGLGGAWISHRDVVDRTHTVAEVDEE